MKKRSRGILLVYELTEVAKMLTLAERYEHDGVVKGADRVVELIKSGLSPDDALRKVKEESVDTLLDD